MPGLAAPTDALDPHQARFRFFDSLSAFFTNRAALGPLLLVVDDLHWADGESLMALRLLVQGLEKSRVLVVATYRDTELGLRSTLEHVLARLVAAPWCRRMRLTGLGLDDVAAFIRDAGITAEGALVAKVYEGTEGNPFFISEIVQLLVSERARGRAAEEPWSLGITPAVRDVIRHRLSRLSRACQDLLGLASVMGREFDLWASSGQRRCPSVRCCRCSTKRVRQS